MLLKLFHKVEREEMLLFCEANATLIPTSDITKQRKLQASFLDENKCKNLKKILANQIQQHFEKIIQYNQLVFIA
jgi:hypothetical protein